jgi:iron complex transport system permease protein
MTDWRFSEFSFRLDRQVPLIALLLVIASFIAIILNLGQGDYPIPVLDIVKTLVGANIDHPNHIFVIHTLRLPRTLVAFMVGISLSISGVIFQGLTRNPLADPSIIGINTGASLAVVIAIVLFPSIPAYVLPFFALVGELLMALLIYGLAWNHGSSSTLLILIGIGLSAIASAFTSLLMTFGSINDVSSALVWLAGSVYGCTWEQTFSLLPWMLVLVPAAFGLARHLNVLNLGEEIAKSLGSRTEWQRGLLVMVAVGLAGSAVATAGTIGFVGLIAPHLGRQLVGNRHEGLLPISALMGGSLVVFADLVGKSVFAPIELPCGVVTAAIGAPFFLYLLVLNRKL